MVLITLNIYSQKSFSSIWIEVDTLKISPILKSTNEGNAALFYLVNNIKLLLRNKNYKLTQIHKEGNAIADYLAHMSAN